MDNRLPRLLVSRKGDSTPAPTYSDEWSVFTDPVYQRCHEIVGSIVHIVELPSGCSLALFEETDRWASAQRLARKPFQTDPRYS